MDQDFGKDTGNPPSEISKSVFEACMNFINGVPEYCFLFLVGYKYKSRKEILSVIKDYFAKNGIDYVLIQTERFVDEFIEALKCRQKRDFQKKYEEIPFLILDGFEMIACKFSTQEEVYRYIRHRFYENKPTLIISAEILGNNKFDKRLSELISDWTTVDL